MALRDIFQPSKTIRDRADTLQTAKDEEFRRINSNRRRQSQPQRMKEKENDRREGGEAEGIQERNKSLKSLGLMR